MVRTYVNKHCRFLSAQLVGALTGLMVLTEEYYLVDFVSETKPDLCSIQMTAKSDPLPDVRIEINAGKTVKLLYSK